MPAPKINLIPYRASRRKAIEKRFYSFLGASAFAAALIIGTIHLFNSFHISSQEERNAFIVAENELLDKQIGEIKKLKEETATMLARKQIVEGLQSNRSRVVQMLNQIAVPPEGVFYKQISQKKDLVTLSGYAQSNTFVAALLTQLEGSQIFFKPKLIETKKITPKQGPEFVEFSIQAEVVNLTKLSEAAQKEATEKAKKKRGSKEK